MTWLNQIITLFGIFFFFFRLVTHSIIIKMIWWNDLIISTKARNEMKKKKKYEPDLNFIIRSVIRQESNECNSQLIMLCVCASAILFVFCSIFPLDRCSTVLHTVLLLFLSHVLANTFFKTCTTFTPTRLIILLVFVWSRKKIFWVINDQSKERKKERVQESEKLNWEHKKNGDKQRVSQTTHEN